MHPSKELRDFLIGLTFKSLQLFEKEVQSSPFLK